MEEIRNEYKAKLLESLAAFQLIEHYLKLCLSEIKNNKEEIEELMEWPMGILINEFEKYSGNIELINNLRDIKELRNYYAHQGFLALYGHTSRNPELISKNSQELETKREFIKDVHDELLEEYWGIHQNTKYGIRIEEIIKPIKSS